MSAFFVALRESVNDPEEMRLYGEKAGLSAQGHHLIPRVQYGRLRMTEGVPFEGAPNQPRAEFRGRQTATRTRPYARRGKRSDGANL